MIVREGYLGRMFCWATAWIGLFVSCVAGAATGTIPAGAAIQLGQSASFTGSFENQARAYADGARMYFDEINQSGGVFGRRIELISLDDGNRDQVAAENTTKLIDDGVFALFGYTWTNTVRPSIKIATEKQVPFFAPYTGDDAMHAAENPYVITTRASFGDELQLIVSHITTLGFTRIAFVGYTSAAGVALRADLERKLQKQNRELIGIGLMEPNSKYAVAAVEKLAGLDAQVIILGVSGADAVSFIEDYNRRSTYRPQLYARSLVGPQLLVDKLGDAAEGIVVSQTAPNPFRRSTPIAKEYQRVARKKKLSAKFSYIELEGFIAAKAFTAAIRSAGPKVDRDRFLQSVAKLGQIDLGGYVLRYAPGKNHGSQFVELSMIGRKGRFVD